jgi:hypothetical protein
MTSGQNNLIVSEVGYCAKDVNEGIGCSGAEESVTAAANLAEMLDNAQPYHEAGWLRALLVYSRSAGGWAMQIEPGVGTLTRQGKALDAFAEGDVGWSMMKVPCGTSTACTAVGAYYPPSGQSKIVGMHWNGIKWQMTQMAPLPVGALMGDLRSVACSSASSCMAVGLYTKYSNPLRILTLAELWNGTEWEVETTPNSGNSPSVLYAVSCISSAACMAVGTDQSKAVAEWWNGSEWKVQNVSAPASSVWKEYHVRHQRLVLLWEVWP